MITGPHRREASEHAPMTEDGTMAPAGEAGIARRWRRLDVLDARPIHLDQLTVEAPEQGLVAFPTAADRRPSLRIEAGRVVEIDGRPEAEFDLLDEFIARFGLDLEVAPEAMAIDSLALARMLVDIDVPRAEIQRLAAGMTPARLAEAVALLRPAELVLAIAKMRVRRTPSNQAHITNRLDDPTLLAADAATAVAYGFRELETTVPILEHAPSNALALLIGSQVGAPGALTQCSVEEAVELELGLRGLTTYAETISLYGTEGAFIDGDDTPWSKAFLCSAYASRGLKMRVTTGAGAEVLMAAAEGSSMASLESRCVSLSWAIGAQGTQNGGIDGASVAGSVPEGFRELLAENLMVMTRGLESCSGNDTLISESDLRRVARTMPLLLAGSDFLFSGFGFVRRHDNMFGPSNLNGEDLDDYLAIQRDWGFDGVLRWPGEASIRERRERAARAVAAVWAELGLGVIDEVRIEAAVTADSSLDLPDDRPHAVSDAAAAIRERRIGLLDGAEALRRRGFIEEAEGLLGMARERVRGDLLQPAAIFDDRMRCLSAFSDPNDYAGPGTGHEVSPERRAEIAAVRGVLDREALLREQASAAGDVELHEAGEAAAGEDPGEVVIAVSPAFGVALHRALDGLSVGRILKEILAGIEEEGARARVVRVRSTIDLGAIGLAGARLAGSGIGIGIQAKGTALIHRRDLRPLQNLELYSVAPIIDARLYRLLGANAARHAKRGRPVPVQNPYTDQAITARHHARVVAMTAVEREHAVVGAPPVDLAVVFPPAEPIGSADLAPEVDAVAPLPEGVRP
jgi:propanediol dehydratase large subunit